MVVAAPGRVGAGCEALIVRATDTIESLSQAQTLATCRLADRLLPELDACVAALHLRTAAAGHVARLTDELARSSSEAQTPAMKQTARAMFGDELSCALGRLAELLQRLWVRSVAPFGHRRARAAVTAQWSALSWAPAARLRAR
jgi:hypothetical protein